MGKKAKSPHILIIRLSAMGDVAMLVPVLLAVIKKYPDLHLTVLTRKRFEAIFNGLPNVKVLHADVEGLHKGFLGIVKLFKQLQPFHFDAVVDAHNVLRTNILKLLFLFRGVRFVQINKGRKEKKALTKKAGKIFKRLKGTHERYAELFGQLGYPISLSSQDTLKKQQVSSNSLKNLGPYEYLVAVAPFATYKSKMYPLEQLDKVIKGLITNKNLKIILFGGGKKEIEKLNNLESAYPKQLFNMAEKLSFQQELSLISNVDVMLSMDSGNGHLAANYGVPVVTLWGVTHPFAGFAPFAQPSENSLIPDRGTYPLIPTSVYGNKWPEGYEKAIASIDPNAVSRRIQELLQKQ